MLHFDFRITMAAKASARGSVEPFRYLEDHDNLLDEIARSPQWVDDGEKEMPRHIALKTAETYRLTTQLYGLVRLHR